MIRHLLASAIANILRAPFTTGANIVTLALGLACFIAAYGIATYWRSADSHHPHSDRTVIITQTVSSATENATQRFNAGSSATLARYLQEDIPEIESLARVFPAPGAAVSSGNAKLLLDAAYADRDFFQIFDFEFVAGSKDLFLADPSGVILTQSAAERLFGAAPALGRPLIVDNGREAIVAGVIAPPKQPSFMGEGPDARLAFGILGHWRASPGGVLRDEQEVWLRSNAFTFAVLPETMSVAQFNQRLPGFFAKRSPKDVQTTSTVALEALPIGELTMRQLSADLLARSGLNLSAASALVGLGGLILIVAAINYSNLATAQAADRWKEIGMCKVLGAGRAGVMTQCWLESTTLALIATALALAALSVAAPIVQAQTGVNVLLFLSQGTMPFAVLGAIAVLAGLFAGAYPALVLSGVRPLEAMRSGRTRGVGPIARILVGVQFASASFLLILVIVTQLQRAHLEGRGNIGHGDPIVVLNNLNSLDIDEEVFRSRLAVQPGVHSVTMTDRLPWSSGRAVVQFARSPGAETVRVPVHLKVVRHDYFETFGLDVLAGRVFSPDRETEPRPFAQLENVVLDRAFTERLGFASPQAAIGQLIYPGPDAPPLRIVGVTDTEVTRLEASEVSGHIYVFAQWRSGSAQFPIIRIDRNNVAAAIESINRTWDGFAPNVPANVRFFDELFAQGFAGYARTGQLFMLLSATAFVIASIGILGIAVHVASRRRHEVAIRRTLGSSAIRVVRLFLTDFSRPVLIGNLLAWPLAWIASEAYLRSFAERLDLSLMPFAFSLAVTLLIAWMAVGGVVLRAASVRPAEVLRHA